MQIHVLKKEEFKPIMRGFVAEKQHWIVIAHSDRGMQLLTKLDSHYMFDPTEYPVFNVLKKDTRQVVFIGLVEKSRVNPIQMAAYLTEFDCDTTPEELTASNGVVLTSGHPRDANSLLKWFESILEDKLFI